MDLPRPLASKKSIYLRRAWLIPGLVLAALVVVGLFPLLLTIALVIDLVFRRWKLTTVRILFLAIAYLIVSVFVQIWGLMVWIMTGFGRRMFSEQGQRLVNPTIEAWMKTMLTLLRLVGLRIRYDQIDPATFDGKVILAARHESLADVFVPTWLGAQAGNRLRVVLAAGLNREPSLDLFGHWSPQFFVRRESRDMRSEVASLKRLTEASDENTAMVIFPEGGLVRPKRRERILKRLDEERPDLAARARELDHLLAPRIAGTSALLDGAPDAALVIVGHSGMDQLTDPLHAWRSIPLEREVVLKTWRFEASEIPDSTEERELWLFDRWAEMDDWIDSRLRDAD